MTAFLTHVSSVIIAFVTIAVFLYIEDDNEQPLKFTTGRVFAALALFNQLTVPLFIFPITIPIIISAILSTRRLEDFLCQSEVQKEFEGIRNMARVVSRSEASLDAFEIDDYDQNGNNDNQLMDTPIPSPMHNLNEIHFPIDSNVSNDYFIREAVPQEIQVQKHNQNLNIKLKKSIQISMSAKMDRNRPHQRSLTKQTQFEISNDLAISIPNGEFSWYAHGNDVCLHVNKLEIPKGKIYFYILFFFRMYNSIYFDCEFGTFYVLNFGIFVSGIITLLLPLFTR